MTVHHVARICHQANKALCEALGDMTQVDWVEAPAWQCESAIKGVQFCLENPDAGPDANHKSWYDQKLQDGWKYGPVKNANLKEHPCMVDYKDLPAEQQAKDALFKAIVGALAPLVETV